MELLVQLANLANKKERLINPNYRLYLFFTYVRFKTLSFTSTYKKIKRRLSDLIPANKQLRFVCELLFFSSLGLALWYLFQLSKFHYLYKLLFWLLILFGALVVVFVLGRITYNSNRVSLKISYIKLNPSIFSIIEDLDIEIVRIMESIDSTDICANAVLCRTFWGELETNMLISKHILSNRSPYSEDITEKIIDYKRLLFGTLT